MLEIVLHQKKEKINLVITRMLRYLSHKKIFDQKIYCKKYRLSTQYLSRIFKLRTILSVSCFLVLVWILRTWGNRVSFGQYSYVFGRETILEQRSSRFHNITVAQSGSLRMLRFDMLGTEGVIHLENPYIVVFDYMRLQLLCLLWNPAPERILLLGLGAGILPKVLHYLSPSTLIDTVEIDSEVINLARKYFEFKEHNMSRIFTEDGRHFIERQPSNQYDVIIIDAFTVNGRIPHMLRTLECLGEYLRILKSTGLVVANFPYEHESRYRQTYARALFKHIYLGVTPNNYILIGLNKDAKIFNPNELQIRAGTLQHSRSLPQMDWTEEIKSITDGNDTKWNVSAIIFTDKIHEDSLGLAERK